MTCEWRWTPSARQLGTPTMPIRGRRRGGRRRRTPISPSKSRPCGGRSTSSTAMPSICGSKRNGCGPNWPWPAATSAHRANRHDAPNRPLLTQQPQSALDDHARAPQRDRTHLPRPGRSIVPSDFESGSSQNRVRGSLRGSAIVRSMEGTTPGLGVVRRRSRSSELGQSSQLARGEGCRCAGEGRVQRQGRTSSEVTGFAARGVQGL